MMTTEEEALKQKLCTNCGYKHDETTHVEKNFG